MYVDVQLIAVEEGAVYQGVNYDYWLDVEVNGFHLPRVFVINVDGRWASLAKRVPLQMRMALSCHYYLYHAGSKSAATGIHLDFSTCRVLTENDLHGARRMDYGGIDGPMAVVDSTIGPLLIGYHPNVINEKTQVVIPFDERFDVFAVPLNSV